MQELLIQGQNSVDEWERLLSELAQFPRYSDPYVLLTEQLLEELAVIVYIVHEYYVYADSNVENAEFQQRYRYIRDRFQASQDMYLPHLVFADNPDGPDMADYNPDDYGPDVVVGCTPEEIHRHTLLFKMKKTHRDPLQQTTCSICLEEFNQGDMIRKLHCLHIYHDTCIRSWLEQKKTCALCVAPIQTNARRSRRLQGLAP